MGIQWEFVGNPWEAIKNTLLEQHIFLLFVANITRTLHLQQTLCCKCHVFINVDCKKKSSDQGGVGNFIQNGGFASLLSFSSARMLALKWYVHFHESKIFILC